MPRRDRDALLSVQRWAAGFLPEPWDVRLEVEAGREPQRPYALIEEVGSARTEGSRNVQDVTVAYALSLFLPRPDDGLRRTAKQTADDLRETVWQAVKWGDLRRPTPDRIPLLSYEPRLATQRVRARDATAGTWRLRHAGQWTEPIPFDAVAADVQAALEPLAPGVVVVARGVGVFDVVFAGALAGTDVPLMDLDVDELVGADAPGIKVVLTGAAAPWRSPSDYLRVTDFSQRVLADETEPELMMVAVDLRCTFARTLPLPFGHMKLQRISATIGSGG